MVRGVQNGIMTVDIVMMDVIDGDKHMVLGTCDLASCLSRFVTSNAMGTIDLG
jgi:hypothetical protein